MAIVGAMFAILTNWEIVTGWEMLIKGRFLFLILAVAFAHAALLLRIETTSVVVRSVRHVTLGIIALTAALLLSITMAPTVVGAAWMALGILAVLDVLGTIGLPILHQITRGKRAGGTSP